jgi:hypothetical protein
MKIDVKTWCGILTRSIRQLWLHTQPEFGKCEKDTTENTVHNGSDLKDSAIWRIAGSVKIVLRQRKSQYEKKWRVDNVH